jgi:hypothetical protein
MDLPAIMMNMTRTISIAGLLGAALLTACSFEKNAVQDITGDISSARIKFYNFGVGAPSVNFYANDTKMTAITSATGAESALGVAYGGLGSGGFYDAIAPGTYTITGKISAATDKDLVVASAPATIVDGKYYSYFISGVYNTTTKTVESFIVEDPIPALDFSKAYVRFVNAIPNSQPMVLNLTPATAGVGTDAVVGAAVPYKSAGDFVGVQAGVAYNLGTRVAGATTDAISRTGITFASGRVYTIAARGSMTVTTGTNAPFLDNTANR